MTCLEYHINKDPYIILGKAAYRVTSVFIREDRLDDGGELIWGKTTPNQMPYRWSVGKQLMSSQYYMT